jgi:hypothetical protein
MSEEIPDKIFDEVEGQLCRTCPEESICHSVCERYFELVDELTLLAEEVK